MSKSKQCQARQYSDQMMCGKCGLCWDMNDPEPPPCPKEQENKEDKHENPSIIK